MMLEEIYLYLLIVSLNNHKYVEHLNRSLLQMYNLHSYKVSQLHSHQNLGIWWKSILH